MPARTHMTGKEGPSSEQSNFAPRSVVEVECSNSHHELCSEKSQSTAIRPTTISRALIWKNGCQ